MPVAGLVVCFLPDRFEEVRVCLEEVPGVEVCGWNEQGEMVVVYEAETFEEMEREIRNWPQKIEGLLSVNVAYLNAEDVLERIEKGEYFPERP